MLLEERLINLRKSKELTQQELADKLHLSRSTYAQYEIGRRQPEYDTLRKLAEFYEVSIDYLLTGKRSMRGLISMPVQSGKTANYDELFKRITENGYNKIVMVQNMEQPSFVLLPIISEISCGEPLYTEDKIIGHFQADKSMINGGGEYVWLRAKGDSMIDVGIQDGSLVLIRLQPEVENNEIAVVCVDEENATLKRLIYADGNVILMPENSKMAPQAYPADRVRVVGKAVYTVKKL